MTRGSGIGATRGDFLRLFDGASAAGLGDGDLLARFVGRRDEAAFEALVARLGPMVLGVCRRMLADPHDVEDAFQATFLVLVRRAGSIRDRDVVATWLYEVAVRVARRARLDAARRTDREQRGAVSESAQDSAPGLDWSEVRAGIDEEIGRLPESHRRLVVLCDVEGLSREEAAARLGWTANMVRGRLERARGRLRDRLTRRGLTPSGAFLALAMPPSIPRPALVAATVRAALSLMIGRTAGLGPALVLSQGVSRMMMLAKWKLAATALISAGAMVAGPGMLAARQGPGDGPAGAKAPALPPPGALGPGAASDPLQPRTEVVDPNVPRRRPPADLLFRPRPAADLARARVEVAQARYDAQAGFYEEGRITIDRLLDASKILMDAERDAADTKPGRIAAVGAHHARAAAVLKREEAELEVGRATTADVAEARSALLEAEFTLARELEAPEPKRAEVAPAADPTARREERQILTGKAQEVTKAQELKTLGQARAEVAGQLMAYNLRLFSGGRIPTESVVAASKVLMEAERDAADTEEGRAAAVRNHISRMNSLVRDSERSVAQGEKDAIEVKRARLGLLEAELLQVRSGEVAGSSGLPDAKAKGPGAGLPDINVVPSPTGNLPTTRPAPNPVANLSPRSLALAVAEFNGRPSSDAAEPPLTEAEVIAAIQFWRPDRETRRFAKGLRTNVTSDSAPIREFRAIAKTREMPAGARIESATSVDVGDDQLYAGHWIYLDVPIPPAVKPSPQPRPPSHRFEIRQRMTRVVPLEEVLDQEKTGRRVHAGLILPEHLPISGRIKNLEDRIEYRDRRRDK